jgi:ankyrin repeat protein
LNKNDSIADNLVVDLQGGSERWTPLHIASYASFYRIVNLLLQSEANLFVRNAKGKTPLGNINNNLLMIKILKKSEIY